MELLLRLTGFILMTLGLFHVFFPKYFKWKEEFSKVSTIKISARTPVVRVTNSTGFAPNFPRQPSANMSNAGSRPLTKTSCR